MTASLPRCYLNRFENRWNTAVTRVLPAVRSIFWPGQFWTRLTAVDRLMQVPVVRDARPFLDNARIQVAESLAIPYEERWRQIWGRFTEMAGLWERDLMW